MARVTARRLGIGLLSAVIAVAALVFGGAYVYIHFISGPAPAPLTLKSASPAASSASAGASGSAGQASKGVSGSWRVAAGSLVGYRVEEVLAGQDNTAVGRSSDVTGSMTIKGKTVEAASFTVQMDTIKSDESERNVQFNGRIMDTATYPTGTLKLTSPVQLGKLPAVGVIKTYHVMAELTLHGHTRLVRFALQAERTSAGIEISGSIPVLFASWDIPNPSFAGFVTTQNHGELEFLIKFSRG
jgi:polyisoprenoid-binding protein YceI